MNDQNQSHAELPDEQYQEGFKSDTPETDKITLNHWGDGFAAKHLKPEMQQIERQLTAARLEIEGLKSEIEYHRKHKEPVTRP
jgi:hypothetical protein